MITGLVNVFWTGKCGILAWVFVLGILIGDGCVSSW